MHRTEDRTKQRRLTLTNARSHHAPAKTQSVRVTSALGFPLNGFTHCLTLFSKFFSSFPHGTCSLSVSRPYLVLEEIYLPLRAALPSNPTLRYNMTTAETHRYVRASHPLRDPIPRNFSRGHDARSIHRLQFGMGTMQILGLNSSRFTRRY